MIRVGARGRALFVCIGLGCVFTVFSARLIHLQVAMHDEYTALAASKHSERKVIYARRGTIQDIGGEILAANDPVRTLVIDGSLVNDVEQLAFLLAEPLGMKRDGLRQKLRTDSRYLVLKKKVPEFVAMDIRREMLSLGLRGIMFEKEAERIYPNGDMLSHVLGFTNHENTGVQGVELVMDNYLRGHNGVRFIERDRTGKELVAYRGQETPAKNGCNVRLTVDMGLQNIVETELDEACENFMPEWATVILMRPQTGEILALANRPTFDPNFITHKTKPEQMKNRAIIDMYEPGSVFKIVGAAAALNEGLVDTNTLIFCENGRFKWGGRTLRDHHGYGSLSVSEILMKSSNIGSAKLAIQLGDQRFYEYVRRFGFGERTGISLPGEIGGVVHPPHRWSKISITRMPMGHEIGTTPLQIATSMSVIANGGELMMPQIIHEITDEQGKIVTQFEPVPVRRVVSKSAAEKVRDALVTVVSRGGTAPLAKVPGFKVAGKTGTAEKVNPKGGYFSHKYVSSFVGFMPAENPAFVGLVVFDDPKTAAGQYYGGFTAAPVFSRIAERAARYLNLVPQPEEFEKSDLIITQSQDD